jgi:hypothetical protein
MNLHTAKQVNKVPAGGADFPSCEAAEAAVEEAVVVASENWEAVSSSVSSAW